MDQGEHEAVRLSRENAIVAEVGSIINSSLDIEDVYERFAEEVRKLVPFDRIAINLLDLKENCSRIAYANGIVVSGRDKGDAVTLNGSLSSEVIKSRKGLFIPTGEIEGYAERFPVFRRTVQAGFRSLMLVPLISKGEVIAILHFRSTLPDVYSEKELRIAERVGYQITSAIVNAQIYAAQKRTEKALRESEKRFKDLYDNAPSGYHEYDLEGRITQVNRTELQLLGYSREEMIGRYVWELNVHTEDARKDVLGRLSGTLPPARELERIFRRKDGTTLPVLITNRIIRDGQGRLTGVRSSLQDITERKRAEEELRQREEQYRNIFESAADGLLILNPSGTIVDANPRACEMYGYRREEILGLSGTSIIHKENRPLFDQFRKGIQERGGFHTEAIGLRKDGSSFHAEVRGGTFQFRGGPICWRWSGTPPTVSARRRPFGGARSVTEASMTKPPWGTSSTTPTLASPASTARKRRCSGTGSRRSSAGLPGTSWSRGMRPKGSSVASLKVRFPRARASSGCTGEKTARRSLR